MPKHIGIVGCSYEGAALCYQTICNEGASHLGEHAHPEVSLHTYPLSDYMPFITTGNWRSVADLMLSSADKLAKTGADFLICPDNTIHQAFELVTADTPLPWLHISETVAVLAQENHYKKLGILGTKYLMEGPVYSEKLKLKNISFVIPNEEERLVINDIIFKELVYGKIVEKSKEYIHNLIQEFKTRGCDAVILGCTEIPLIVLPHESVLPVLDSTRILARAALNYAIDKKFAEKSDRF
ncbi:amino acid racemase [candidate division KSB1 bacterium]|nr:amino acid racemase [candidate division KSB1 bacterium]